MTLSTWFISKTAGRRIISVFISKYRFHILSLYIYIYPERKEIGHDIVDKIVSKEGFAFFVIFFFLSFFSIAKINI